VGATWLKLRRTGNTISSFVSTDGQTWTPLGTTVLTLGATAEVGLFVCSHNGSQLNTSAFDNVSVTPTVL
jgi:regulation of enolase protein 1 (concanavalin A-like superfamily)